MLIFWLRDYGYGVHGVTLRLLKRHEWLKMVTDEVCSNLKSDQDST